MKDEDSKALLAILGIPVFMAIIFIGLVPLGLFNAWAVQKMYIWFALPLGAPDLNLAHIWGFSLIANHYLYRSEKSDRKAWVSLLLNVLATLLMLLMGFILKNYI